VPCISTITPSVEFILKRVLTHLHRARVARSEDNLLAIFQCLLTPRCFDIGLTLADNHLHLALWIHTQAVKAFLLDFNGAIRRPHQDLPRLVDPHNHHADLEIQSDLFVQRLVEGQICLVSQPKEVGVSQFYFQLRVGLGIDAITSKYRDVDSDLFPIHLSRWNICCTSIYVADSRRVVVSQKQ
jgi:hypothetical protein